MNKNTKIILGVLAIGAVGYFIWNQSQKEKTPKKKFANAAGRKKMNKKNADGVPVKSMKDANGKPIIVEDGEGNKYYKMKSGNLIKV